MIPDTAIDTVETILVDLPTIRPHQLSVATMRSQTLALVRIRCRDGREGWGEATTIGGLQYGEESPESVKTNIDRHLAPLLLGEDARGVGRLLVKLRRGARGNRFAKCALETALLDIQAQRLGVPMSDLLGGRLRDSLPVAWTLASGDTGRDIAEAEDMLERRRHRVFKLKIGLRAPEDDVAHVLAICRALEGRASVRVDVNQAWSEMQAERAIARLQDGGVELIEQPVPREHPAALARLARRFEVPIMADESLHGPADANQLARLDAADVFAVKIAQSGGLFAARQVAEIAAVNGLGLYGGTMLEGGIGTIASAQLFATFEKLDWGSELFGPLLLTEELLTEPLCYRDFELHLPSGPGLGVRPDPDKLATLRRDRTAPRLHAV